MPHFPAAFFVTGTDTNVGKTVVSAILCAGLGADYWKPIQSGTIDGTDSQWIRSATQLPDQHFHQESYSLAQPLSPHAAALIDNTTIDLANINLPVFTNAHLVVEGAGGVMVPLNQNQLMIDLMAKLRLPVIVVARSGLGTINHTLLTLGKLREKNLSVIGVVLNGPLNSGNVQAIEDYGQVRVIAQVEPLTDLNYASLSSAFTHSFGDWLRDDTNYIPHMAPLHSDEDRRTATLR